MAASSKGGSGARRREVALRGHRGRAGRTGGL